MADNDRGTNNNEPIDYGSTIEDASQILKTLKVLVLCSATINIVVLIITSIFAYILYESRHSIHILSKEINQAKLKNISISAELHAAKKSRKSIESELETAKEHNKNSNEKLDKLTKSVGVDKKLTQDAIDLNNKRFKHLFEHYLPYLVRHNPQKNDFVAGFRDSKEYRDLGFDKHKVHDRYIIFEIKDKEIHVYEPLKYDRVKSNKEVSFTLNSKSAQSNLFMNKSVQETFNSKIEEEWKKLYTNEKSVISQINVTLNAHDKELFEEKKSVISQINATLSTHNGELFEGNESVIKGLNKKMDEDAKARKELTKLLKADAKAREELLKNDPKKPAEPRPQEIQDNDENEDLEPKKDPDNIEGKDATP